MKQMVVPKTIVEIFGHGFNITIFISTYLDIFYIYALTCHQITTNGYLNMITQIISMWEILKVIFINEQR